MSDVSPPPVIADEGSVEGEEILEASVTNRRFDVP